MTSLADLQNDFGRFLLDGNDRIVGSVASTPGLDTTLRLQIYANAYRTRFAEVLANDFPALRAFLGIGPFKDLSEAYIVACPSTSFTLREFGRRLPWFIESRSGLSVRAFAAELAAFEWGFVDAFDAVDEGAVGVAEMAGIPPEAWPRLELESHPSVQVVPTRFNTPRIWNAVKAQEVLPRAVEQTDAAACLIWRQELTCVFRSMQPIEFAAWRVVARGESFAAMCDALIDWLPADEIPMRAASLLRTWLIEGLVGALRAP